MLKFPFHKILRFKSGKNIRKRRGNKEGKGGETNPFIYLFSRYQKVVKIANNLVLPYEKAITNLNNI